MRDRRVEAVLFGLVMLLNVGIYTFLIMDRRMPRCHDGLQLYQLRFVFFSHAAAGGGVPFWIPCMTQGTVSSMAFALATDIPQGVTLLLARLLEDANFLTLFLLQFLFDEVLLLIGIWRLGRWYGLSPPALFFVGVAITGTNFWPEQPAFTFLLYYAVPLVMALLHEALAEGSRVKLCLAANLFLLQALANPPYILLIAGLAVAVYFAVHATLFWRQVRPGLRAWRPVRVDLLWALSLAVSLGVVLCMGFADTHNVVLNAQGRNPDGTNSLQVFLAHGGRTDPLRYLDLIFGLGPHVDSTYFCGYLTLAFAFLALFTRPVRATLQMMICMVLAMLFSLGAGSVVGPMSFYFVPGLAYYRHVALIVPVVKLFLVLLAGFGFEGFVRDKPWCRAPAMLASAGLVLVALVEATVAAAARRHSPWTLELPRLLAGCPPVDERLVPEVLNYSTLSSALSSAATCAAFAGFLLLVYGLSRRALPTIIVLILFIHPLDLFGWKFYQLFIRTAQQSRELQAAEMPRGWRYQASRAADGYAGRRLAALPRTALGVPGCGDLLWFAQQYIEVDTPFSGLRTDYWMRPLNDFM
ncbi:MAG: hypothetical protein HY815_05400, partial [Candidatus Riflebacteria bacterium]|nr:hypothetical protein [Candidatus Riflebacteria bacterium]